MSTNILGLGTALPEHTVSMDEAIAMSTELICRNEKETRLLRTMHRKAHVENRHTCVPHRIAYQWIGEGTPPSSSPGPTTKKRMALYAQHAKPLAIASSAKALESSGVSAAEITHLITVSCTGFDAPGVDVHLIDQLGLPKTTQRIHIGFMGCHGAINGLRAARGIVAADPKARVLLCTVELCSLHFKFQWDPELMLGNVLFADGSAALVLASGQADDGAICTLRDTGSCILDDSREAITWNVGDSGFDMSLSNRVPGLIGEQLRPWLVDWLDSLGYSIDSIGSWAVHPGGPKILASVDEALGFDAEMLSPSRAVLSEVGNMSSPTMLFILDRILKSNAARPCVMLGFGPGLAAEAALLE